MSVMMPSYQLLFEGQLVAGHDAQSVRQRFGRVFKLEPERVEEIFNARRVILSKGLSREGALDYQGRLRHLGMETRMEMQATAAEYPTDGTADGAVSASHLPSQEGAYQEDSAYDGSYAEAHREALERLGETPPRLERSEYPAMGGADPAAHLHPLPFEFHGSGRQYFKIWIVNIFLTIITLGVYSAWAKVRTQRYFYSNTRLDGAAFEYLARPVDILRGRALAFLLFAIYSAAGVDMVASIIASIAFALILPWLMVKSLAFRARNSAYRNVRFRFTGSVKGAAMAFVVWPLLGMVTLGALFPKAIQRQHRYVVENSRYGEAPFTFHATAGDYFRPLFGGTLALVALALVSPVLGLSYFPLTILAFPILYLAAFTYFTVTLANLRWNNACVAEHHFSAGYRYGSFARLVATNTLLIIATLGLYYPFAKVRNARYAAEHTLLLAAGDLLVLSAEQEAKMSAFGAEAGDLFDVEVGL